MAMTIADDILLKFETALVSIRKSPSGVEQNQSLIWITGRVFCFVSVSG